ncbi:MAG: maltose acetyltransferase domain-containing protein [Acidimicrobiales bacterium]
MLAGELYSPADPELVTKRARPAPHARARRRSHGDC